MTKFEQYEEKLENLGFTTCEQCRDYAVQIQEELVNACENWEELFKILENVFQVTIELINYYNHQRINNEELDNFYDHEPFIFEADLKYNWVLIIRII